MKAAPFTLCVRILEAEVVETLLCWCVSWTLGQTCFAEPRMAPRWFLLKILASSTDNNPKYCTSCM